MYIDYSKLWKLLIDKGITRSNLHEITGIGQSTFVKLSKGKNVNTEVLVRICKAYGIRYQDGGIVFQRKANEIRDIVDVCKKYGITYENGNNVFRKTSANVEGIALACLEYGVNCSDGGIIFCSDKDDIRSVFEVCEKYGIKYKDGGSVFLAATAPNLLFAREGAERITILSARF